MSTITRQPTSNTTPDPGQGGNAVTGAINTGHGATTSSGSQLKTCLWTAFQTGLPGAIQKIDLKFDWTITGSVNANTSDPGDIAQANIDLEIDFSLNGGGAWSNKVSRSLGVSVSDGSSNSDSINTGASQTQSIAISQDLSQIRVRDSISSSTLVIGPGSSASASLTVVVSNIRLEIVIGDTLLVMM